MIVDHDRPFDAAQTTASNGRILLSQISPSDKRWCHHKMTADLISSLYRGTELGSYSLRMDDCFNSPVYRQIENLDTGEVSFKLYDARFCRVPRCPVCQVARMRVWLSKSHGLSDKLYEDYPTAKFIFLTLTVKNCHITELKSTINSMNSAWKRLIQLGDFPALGFLKTLEVTREYLCPHQDKHLLLGHKFKKPCPDCLATDYVHPHFHCLLMVTPSYFTGKNYLSQAIWTDLWRQSLRVDYTPMVHVKSVKSLNSKDNRLSEALKETIKYAVKPQDILNGNAFTGLTDQQFLIELTCQLYKVRAISTGGLLKQYLVALEREPEELIHFDNDQELDENQVKAQLINFAWTKYLTDFLGNYRDY